MSDTRENAVGPPRRSIATMSRHADAERTADTLIRGGFPVSRVAIVGSGLSAVEQVVGRQTRRRAALAGAVRGAPVGAFAAVLFDAFFPGVAFSGLLVYGVATGAVLGAAYRGIEQAALGGRRSFAAVGVVQAERYDVLVDDEVADEARRLMQSLAR